MMEKPVLPQETWTFRRVMNATLILLSVVFGFWLIYRFYQVIFVFAIAILLGTVIRPAVGWLHRKGLPEVAGIMIVFVLLLGFLTGFMFLLFPLIIAQGTTIVAAVPGYYQNLRNWAINSPSQIILSLSGLLPATLTKLVPSIQTGQQVLVTAEQAIGYVSSFIHVIFMAVAILLLVFLWILKGPQAIKAMLLLLPEEKRDGIDELIHAMETKISAYIVGESILCLTIGVMALISYMIIGLPNALTLALIAGVFEAVPMIGPFLGAIPAGVVAFSIGPIKLLWVVISTVIIQQLENYLLVPRVMRKAVGVNPFVSLLAIFAFTSFFGIAGALMAIPLAVIIQLALDHFIFHPIETLPNEAGGRNITGRLRYEARDFAQDLRKQARIKKSGSDQRVKEIDQVMDEIEGITDDLDALLAQTQTPGEE
jgi:predicted PurR-regulated permease PerM